MKKIKTIISVVCAALVLTSTAFADDINVSFNKVSRLIELDGTLGAQYANSRILALVLDGNTVLPDLKDIDYIEGVSSYLDNVITVMQINSDENGNYQSDDIEADPVVGNIKVYIAADTMEKAISKDLFIPTKEAVDTFCEDIEKASTDDAIFAILEKESSTPYFGADMKYYNKIINKTYKQNVANAVYNNKNKYSSSDKIQKTDDDIFIHSYLAYLSEIDEKTEIEKLLDIENSDYSTIDKRRISRLIKLDELYQNSAFKYLKSKNASKENDVGEIPKDEILELISKMDIHTPQLFEDAVYISIINYKFSVANGWRDAYTIMKDHIDVLDGITETKLSSIQNNQELLSDIISKSYASVDKLCDAVNNWKRPDTSSGSSSSSGSGGSSSGSFVPTISVGKDTNLNSQINNNVETQKLFTDIADYAWANTAIETLYKRNIISGYGDGIYNPGGKVSREEFVKMIVNAIKLECENKEPLFDDVKSDKWYYDCISKAVSAGIITGMSSSEFGVGEPVTRQDMAVIVCRAIYYLGLADVNMTDAVVFDDSEVISDYAKASVSALYRLGIVSGQGNNMFAPLNNMTRAEAAVVLYNIINKFGL